MRCPGKLLCSALYCENFYILDTAKYVLQNKEPHFPYPEESIRTCTITAVLSYEVGRWSSPVEAADKRPLESAVYPSGAGAMGSILLHHTEAIQQKDLPIG